MTNKKTIIVIATIISNKKVFVGRHTISCERGTKKIVSYTAVPEEAKEFKTKGLAMDFIAIIKNPHERIFQWDAAVVDTIKQKTFINKLAAEEVLQKVS